jgi:hypothetical protein
MHLLQSLLSLCALMVAGAESSLAGAEQQWNDAMKVLDDKLQASPHHLIPALFPLRDPCAFLTSAARMLTLCTALTAAMLQC